MTVLRVFSRHCRLQTEPPQGEAVLVSKFTCQSDCCTNSKHWFTASLEEGAGKRCSECDCCSHSVAVTGSNLLFLFLISLTQGLQ